MAVDVPNPAPIPASPGRDSAARKSAPKPPPPSSLRDPDGTPEEMVQSIGDHIEELRWRIIRTLIVFAAALLIFLIGFPSELLKICTYPLNAPTPLLGGRPPNLPGELTVLKVFDRFMLSLITSVVAALIVAGPYALIEGWRFIAPGLFPHERKLIRIYFPSITGLFAAGLAFGYFVLLPVALDYMLNFGLEEQNDAVAITSQLTMDSYLSFFFLMTVVVGVIFEIPVIMMGITRVTDIDARVFKKYRRHWAITALVIGMLLTPPDVVTQCMLAGPMVLLYELGIVLAGVAERKRDRLRKEFAEGDDPWDDLLGPSEPLPDKPPQPSAGTADPRPSTADPVQTTTATTALPTGAAPTSSSSTTTSSTMPASQPLAAAGALPVPTSHGAASTVAAEPPVSSKPALPAPNSLAESPPTQSMPGSAPADALPTDAEVSPVAVMPPTEPASQAVPGTVPRAANRPVEPTPATSPVSDGHVAVDAQTAVPTAAQTTLPNASRPAPPPPGGGLTRPPRPVSRRRPEAPPKPQADVTEPPSATAEPGAPTAADVAAAFPADWKPSAAEQIIIDTIVAHVERRLVEHLRAPGDGDSADALGRALAAQAGAHTASSLVPAARSNLKPPPRPSMVQTNQPRVRRGTPPADPNARRH